MGRIHGRCQGINLKMFGSEEQESPRLIYCPCLWDNIYIYIYIYIYICIRKKRRFRERAPCCLAVRIIL